MRNVFRRPNDTVLRAQAALQWEQWISTAPAGVGSFVVAVFGPKDPKTSTAVAIATTLVRLRGGLVLAVCANPDFGTLRSRLLGAQPPRSSRSLVELAHALTHPDPARRLQVSSLDDLAPYLERGPGGLLVASNDGVPVADVYDLRIDQWAALFDTLRRHVNVMVVDEGRSQVGPIADGLLRAADHLVVPMPTSPREVNDIVKPGTTHASTGPASAAGAGALAQVAARGHGPLIARCTAVITALRPGVDPEFIADRLNQGAGTFYAHAVAVPYDPAVTDPTDGTIAPATRLAYALLTARVVAAMDAPRLSAHQITTPVVTTPVPTSLDPTTTQALTSPASASAPGPSEVAPGSSKAKAAARPGMNGQQLAGRPAGTLDTGGTR